MSSEGSDEPAHLRSIYTAFAARTGKMTHEAMSMKVQALLCPSKAVVRLLLIHSLIFLPLDW